MFYLNFTTIFYKLFSQSPRQNNLGENLKNFKNNFSNIAKRIISALFKS